MDKASKVLEGIQENQIQMKLIPWNLKQVFGGELIDVEHNQEPESVSGSEEVILHFSNGKEILIYVNSEGDVMIEGD